jgi:hypothetical protein
MREIHELPKKYDWIKYFYLIFVTNGTGSKLYFYYFSV